MQGDIEGVQTVRPVQGQRHHPALELFDENRLGRRVQANGHGVLLNWTPSDAFY